MKYVLVLVVAAAVALGWLLYRTGKEVVSEIMILSAEAKGGTALVVYHPGLSGFHEKATRAFAEGLVSSGWRVEITTASSQAPADMSNYDLVVLGGPTYQWGPARSVQDYIRRLGDLDGKRTVTIVSGMGSTGRSVAVMERLVREVNGNLVKSLPIWTLAPNEEVYGISDPVEIMRRAGAEIALPAR